MKKIKTFLNLLLTMFKIGLFTFGGGYAMVAVFESEFVSNKKWIEQEEFTDLIAIAESTPGPIAINSATYIGYRVGGVIGSIFSTVGVFLPSLIIIYVISLFFNQFLEIKYVAYAFKGIQACVSFLILSAGIKMFLKSKKDIFSVIIFTAVAICTVAFALFGVDFSSIYFILIGAALGLTLYLIIEAVKRGRGVEKAGEEKQLQSSDTDEDTMEGKS